MGTSSEGNGLQILGKRAVIFLTLGTQLPFDRLVRTLDEVAPDLKEEIVGQIGAGSYLPKNFESVQRLDPVTFNNTFLAARVVVAHAGIGTVLSARKFQKPLMVMARRASAREHRNDHQLATAGQLRRIPGVSLFETANELRELLKKADLTPLSNDMPPALDSLIRQLSAEIFGPR